MKCLILVIMTAGLARATILETLPNAPLEIRILEAQTQEKYNTGSENVLTRRQSRNNSPSPSRPTREVQSTRKRGRSPGQDQIQDHAAGQNPSGTAPQNKRRKSSVPDTHSSRRTDTDARHRRNQNLVRLGNQYPNQDPTSVRTFANFPTRLRATIQGPGSVEVTHGILPYQMKEKFAVHDTGPTHSKEWTHPLRIQASAHVQPGGEVKINGSGRKALAYAKPTSESSVEGSTLLQSWSHSGGKKSWSSNDDPQVKSGSVKAASSRVENPVGIVANSKDIGYTNVKISNARSWSPERSPGELPPKGTNFPF